MHEQGAGGVETPAGVDRRDMLRMFLGIPVGLAVGQGLISTSGPTQDAAHRLTGLDVGNAFEQREIHDTCGEELTQTCLNRLGSSDTEIVWGEVVPPLAEEFYFRVLPSCIRDVVTDRDHEVKPALRRVLFGREKVPLTRGEFLTGVISALIFGAAHNVTARSQTALNTLSVNTTTLPVEQTIGGGALWVLQRKFGFFSNAAAHAIFNAEWLKHPN